MNMILKSAVAGALALGATSAFALTAPSTGASDLVLVVQNDNTQATYVLDTTISISSLMPGSGSYTPGAVLSTALAGVSKTIAESPALQTFLAAPAGAAGFSWGIEAAQFSTTTGSASTANVRTAGKAVGVFTSNFGTGNTSNISGFTLTNLVSYANGVNIDTQSGNALNPLLTSSESSGGPAYNAGDQQKYGLFASNDLSTLGTASKLFGLTGNGGTGQLQSYILGTATLGANGVLTITGNGGGAPVPLPAAVWLFGSGLMGLVGISRRRKAAV